MRRSGLYRADPGLYEQRLIEKCAQLGFDGVFAAHSHTTVYSRVTGKPAEPDVPCRENELN